ncbi:unnamed protein product [Discula destructiva]
MADLDLAPKVTIVRDLQDRQMAYVSMDDLGFAGAMNAGFSFQEMAYGGQEPVTVFADHSLSRFVFAPALMKEILLASASCEHLYDIPKQPAKPREPQHPASASRELPTLTPATPAAPPPAFEQSQHASRAFGHGAPNQPYTPSRPTKQTKQQRIKRPRNSWIIYRSQKSKELHQNNPNMSAGAISTEVARMWANETQETKDYFKTLQDIEAQDHREKYPGWSYKLGKSPEKN